MSTAEACVFGAAPNAVDAPEKIFDAVDSCACVSSPMTTSQRHRATSGGAVRTPERRRLVPIGRLLEPVRDVEQRRLGESSRPAICSPIGRPVAIEAAGIDIAGAPVRFAGDR